MHFDMSQHVPHPSSSREREMTYSKSSKREMTYSKSSKRFRVRERVMEEVRLGTNSVEVSGRWKKGD